jgi:hypothetical protein
LTLSAAAAAGAAAVSDSDIAVHDHGNPRDSVATYPWPEMFRIFRQHKQQETESVDGVQANFVLVDKPTTSGLDMERVRRVFEIFDSDKDGCNKQQLLCALHSLGYKYRMELLCTVMHLGDTNKIDLPDFEGFVRKVDEAEILGLKSLSGTNWMREAKD